MKEKINLTIEKQRKFYSTHKTRDLKYRVENLKKLKNAILSNIDDLYEAFHKDLRKSKTEAYGTEIGLVLSELSLFIKKTKRWGRPRRVPTGLLNFKSVSYVYPEPFGHVLLVSPWNYPFLLLFQPLIAAIAT
ncbi:MAG: aldehyde dehydrogenase family protein, partial [Bacteroidota bacterium]|nr:aldehyde dehydrogenase family protein [Bacteroidota bacterium]